MFAPKSAHLRSEIEFFSGEWAEPPPHTPHLIPCAFGTRTRRSQSDFFKETIPV